MSTHTKPLRGSARQIADLKAKHEAERQRWVDRCDRLAKEQRSLRAELTEVFTDKTNYCNALTRSEQDYMGLQEERDSMRRWAIAATGLFLLALIVAIFLGLQHDDQQLKEISSPPRAHNSIELLSFGWYDPIDKTYHVERNPDGSAKAIAWRKRN